MILWKFLKQQDWKYGLPCLFFLFGIIRYKNFDFIEIIETNYLVWHFVCATGFLICYSLKYAGKHNNLIIDLLKLIFYFVYFTVLLLFFEDDDKLVVIRMSLLPILFFLYFYTLFLNYKQEMEQKEKRKGKISTLIIMIAQSVLIIGIIIWAITQKVEAEKQKVLALGAKIEAEKAMETSKEAAMMAEKLKLQLEEVNIKNLECQGKYEALQKGKK